MITYLQGKLIEKNPTKLVIDVSGVGFDVHIPLSTFAKIGQVGNFVSILTYLHVREDSLQLFGFASKEERELFLKLISVQGIGPKLAQGVLSGISVEDFRNSIVKEDYSTLTSISGIGRRTAQRLIVDLKEKLELDTAREVATLESGVVEEAILALVSLGYKRASAKAAIERALSEIAPGSLGQGEKQQRGEFPVEELIKKALKKL